MDQFEAKYKELNDKKTDLDNKINAIDLSKVSDADYQAAVQQVAEVRKAKEAKGEFTFDIPAAIQDGFARMILEKQTLDNNDLANSFRPAIPQPENTIFLMGSASLKPCRRKETY